MKDYKRKAEQVIRTAKNRYSKPTKRNTTRSIVDKLTYLQKVLKKVDVDLKNFGNRYIKENDISDIDVKKIQEINTTLIKKLIDKIGLK